MVEATVRLVAIWLVLLALVGAIAALEYGKPEQSENADGGLLLPVPVEKLGAIELGHAGSLHRFERDDGGAWRHHGAAGASAERIDKAFAAFGRTRVERRLPLDAQYGVAAPQLMILVYGTDEARPLAQYAVGDIAPDTFSRYVLQIGSTEVVTIPNYQIENLLELVKSTSHDHQRVKRNARNSAPGRRALDVERSP